MVGIDQESLSGGAYRGRCCDCGWVGPSHYATHTDPDGDFAERLAEARAHAGDDADAHLAEGCRRTP